MYVYHLWENGSSTAAASKPAAANHEVKQKHGEGHCKPVTGTG